MYHLSIISSELFELETVARVCYYMKALDKPGHVGHLRQTDETHSGSVFLGGFFYLIKSSTVSLAILCKDKSKTCFVQMSH